MLKWLNNKITALAVAAMFLIPTAVTFAEDATVADKVEDALSAAKIEDLAAGAYQAVASTIGTVGIYIILGSIFGVAIAWILSIFRHGRK